MEPYSILDKHPFKCNCLFSIFTCSAEAEEPEGEEEEELEIDENGEPIKTKGSAASGPWNKSSGTAPPQGKGNVGLHNQTLMAYSQISYKGRSQTFQNLNFLHLFVALP